MLVSWLSVESAAALLKLHPTRVRRLIAGGELDAQKVGRDWLIDPISLERLRLAERPRGRPLAPAHAWALLWLASGDSRLQRMAADWTEPWAASRLRRALSEGNWRQRLPLLRRRAHVFYLRAHPSDLPRLAKESCFIATGVGAAQAHGFDVVAPGIVEGYVPAHCLDELQEKYMLGPSPQPNAILHVVDEPW